MKSLGLFSQISAIIISVVIGVFFVQPIVTEIGEIQTDISSYQDERQKVQVVNASLAEDVTFLQGISPLDRQKLATYMPRVVDDIAVLRDIEFMVAEAGLVYNSLAYEGIEQEVLSFVEDVDSVLGDNVPTKHSFSVDVTGRYTDIKTFMRILEQNNYPLEIHALDIAALETGSMSASMTLVTYSDDVVLLSNNLDI